MNDGGQDPGEAEAEPEGSHALSAASGMKDVTEPERALIEEHSRPNAALIHETIRADGENELGRSVHALLLSGFAAGLTIGLSLITEGIVRAHLPDAPWADLVSKVGYSVGFLVVVLGRQQLFTENTLTPILPLLYNRDARTLRRVARLWALILVANLAGTWVMAFALHRAGIFSPEVAAAFSTISHHVIEADFAPTLIRAVFAGWLIALMVWLLPGAQEARLVVIVLLTWLISAGGFAHIIAGSVEVAYLVLSGQAGAHDYLLRFFAPTILGNVLGGVTLVAALNYGQVASEVQK